MKLGQFEFKGQHADLGLRGLTSCTTVVTEFLGQMLNQIQDSFCYFFPPPSELKKENLKNSCDMLSRIVLKGNTLHYESASVVAVEKRKHYKKIKPSTLHIYGKLLKGKEFARGMYKITTSLPGYEHVKELILLSNDTLNKKNLEEYVKKSYEKFAIQGIDENKVAFISGAAAHTTCFFSKMRKKEKLYYLFDSAPARSMGGAYTTGTMEVHDHLGSLIDSLKSRWRMFHFNFREGNIYTVTTLHNVHDKNLNAYLSARSFACFKNYSL